MSMNERIFMEATNEEQIVQERRAETEAYVSLVSGAECKMARRKLAYKRRQQDIENAFCFWDPRNGICWILWLVTAVYLALEADSFIDVVLVLSFVNTGASILMLILVHFADKELERRLKEIDSSPM